MTFKDGEGGKNLTYFYSETGKILSKSAFVQDFSISMTEEQKNARLDAEDETYISPPGVDCNMDAYRDVQAEFDFREFIDVDAKLISDIIKSTKKIEKFYKTHAEVLEPAIVLLAKAAVKTRYFPNALSDTRCTFFTCRAIHSLAPLPKIIEKVFHVGLNQCYLRYEAKFGE